jgi:uncharacterized protein (TIGR03067 family)
MSMRMAMTMAAGLLIAGFGARAAAGDKDDAVKADLKLLAGVWILQTFETSGKPAAADTLKNIKLTIKGDRYLVDLGEKQLELTFKIDPARKPKAIDFVLSKDDKKAVTHAIYEVSADTFKLCRPTEAGKDRPTAFSTKEGSGTVMAIYKRG